MRWLIVDQTASGRNPLFRPARNHISHSLCYVQDERVAVTAPVPAMKPFWCHYNWIEDTIRGYAQVLRQAGIEDVVAIQRGGIFPGLVAAYLLDILMLHTLQHERKSRICRWTCATPPESTTLLLVDDIAGAGDALTDAKRWLEERGHAVKTLTVADMTAPASSPISGSISYRSIVKGQGRN